MEFCSFPVKGGASGPPDTAGLPFDVAQGTRAQSRGEGLHYRRFFTGKGDCALIIRIAPRVGPRDGCDIYVGDDMVFRHLCLTQRPPPNRGAALFFLKTIQCGQPAMR